MSETSENLLSFNGAPAAPITIDGVKDLIEQKVPFRCVYDLVGFTQDGKPRYRCVYVLKENSEAFALVATRIGKRGAEVRLFNIWPGLFKHHHEFGDGKPLCFDAEFRLKVEV